MTAKLYGQRPTDLGPLEFELAERMFWLYCPIKMAEDPRCHLPFNLKPCEVILDAVKADVGDRWASSYVYLNVRNNILRSNRSLAWHSDGFLTNDVSYIWYDSVPTIFWEPPERVAVTQKRGKQFGELGAFAEGDTTHYQRYPAKHLLKMDQYVVHRDDGANYELGEMRTIIKVTVSENRYVDPTYSSNGAFPDWKERT